MCFGDLLKRNRQFLSLSSCFMSLCQVLQTRTSGTCRQAINYPGKSRIHGLDSSYCVVLNFIVLFPQLLQLLFWSQALGDEIERCGLLSMARGTFCCDWGTLHWLLVASLLSFSWVVCLFDWSEDLGLVLPHLTDSVGGCMRKRRKESSSADVSHSRVGRRLRWGAMSQRADWTSAAHDHCMLMKMTPWFSIWTTFVFCISPKGRKKKGWTEN